MRAASNRSISVAVRLTQRMICQRVGPRAAATMAAAAGTASSSTTNIGINSINAPDECWSWMDVYTCNCAVPTLVSRDAPAERSAGASRLTRGGAAELLADLAQIL